jgi:hypothetical protein
VSRKKHRDHVVKELLHTEETYIKGLTKMMEVLLLFSLCLGRT